MTSTRLIASVFFALCALPLAAQEVRHVYLQDQSGQRIEIATLKIALDGGYTAVMNETNFSDHFLSMRPFKCLEGQDKTWCHVPYPYAIARDISDDLIDLEYDFLFLWKGRTDYGIDMWNGVYYRLQPIPGGYGGQLHEMDMDLLSAPPDPGVMRPLRAQDIIKSDPESHWLPELIIE